MTLWRQTFKVGCKVSLVSVHSLKDTPTLTKTVKHTKGFFNVISLTLERSDVVQTKKDDLDIPLRLGCCGWLPTVNASIGTDRQVLMGMPVIGNYSSCGLGIWFDQTLRNHVFFTAVKLLISTISVCVCVHYEKTFWHFYFMNIVAVLSFISDHRAGTKKFQMPVKIQVYLCVVYDVWKYMTTVYMTSLWSI